jgi:CheY-like chemotaxis protein
LKSSTQASSAIAVHVHGLETRSLIVPHAFLSGVGVSKDKIEHIFDAFSQVQDGQVTGTGLGLFGVRTRAEGLHGACGARHNPRSPTGTGTIIWFAIPYAPDRMYRELTRQGSSGSTVADMMQGSPVVQIARKVLSNKLCAAGTVLVSTGAFADLKLTAIVVDDKLTVRKLMEKMLLRMGFARVDCYENGSKGLDAMMAGQVDIVFSDVQMPIMTGPEVRAASCGVSPAYLTLLYPLSAVFWN